MPSLRLAIVGASARAAAASAARAGFGPVAADLFGDLDLQRICPATIIGKYPTGFADWLSETNIDGWIYTGGLENEPALVEQMSAMRPLWGNGAAMLRAARSPWRLSEVLRTAGLRFPAMRQSPDGLPLDGSWLAKSGSGAGGSGVRMWDGNHRPHDRIFQERIDGVPIAALFVAAAGQAALVGVSEQLVGESWTGASQFQYCGSIGPWLGSEVQRQTIRSIGITLAREFRLVGLFGVDMIATAEDVWAIEVNPRYTASVEVLERAHGLYAIDLHVRACSDELLPPDEPAGADIMAGKAILFARQKMQVSPRFAEWSAALSAEQPWPAMGDVPVAGTDIPARRPVATVFASGTDAEAVRAELIAQVAATKQKLLAT